MLSHPCSLYILPMPLSETGQLDEMPTKLSSVIKELDGVICETPKVARHFFKKFPLKRALQELLFLELNEHTKERELEEIVSTLEKGGHFALVSDCGLACIADPGSTLISHAKKKGIRIKTLAGPCSITMALQLSGLIAQRFSFHSYLPKEPSSFIKMLERRSKEEKSIQICIETPYRNQTLFELFLNILEPSTELCIGIDLGGNEEQVLTHTIEQWRKTKEILLKKIPTIFLFLA